MTTPAIPLWTQKPLGRHDGVEKEAVSLTHEQAPVVLQHGGNALRRTACDAD